MASPKRCSPRYARQCADTLSWASTWRRRRVCQVNRAATFPISQAISARANTSLTSERYGAVSLFNARSLISRTPWSPAGELLGVAKTDMPLTLSRQPGFATPFSVPVQGAVLEPNTDLPRRIPWRRSRFAGGAPWDSITQQEHSSNARERLQADNGAKLDAVSKPENGVAQGRGWRVPLANQCHEACGWERVLLRLRDIRSASQS